MIVYTQLRSIEKDLGVDAQTLYALSNNIHAHYRSCRIEKKSGGFRALSVPDEALKSVQRKIADRLLVMEEISPYATAYAADTNIKSNALPHLRKEKILKLDIYKFFDSVSYIQVKDKAFPKNRYSENIRILLAMLCYYKDSLPQGAPTSPTISNIIMRDFDLTVGAFCEERGINYTRYCDDMTFSGDFDGEEVIAFVRAELKKNGFLLNLKKIKSVKRGEIQRVTGIVVNEKLNVGKDYKREIRSAVYYCKKYGVSSHLLKTGNVKTPEEFLRSLLGKINYVLNISYSEEFAEYKKFALELLNGKKDA